MESVEIAWLAGFFEGEGSATIQWRGEHPGRVIHFDNTDKDVMEYISKLLDRPLYDYPYSASAVRTGHGKGGSARVCTHPVPRPSNSRSFSSLISRGAVAENS